MKEQIVSMSKQEQADLMYFLVELMTGVPFQLSNEWKSEIDVREATLESGKL